MLMSYERFQLVIKIMKEEEKERPEAIELFRKEFFTGDLNIPRDFSEPGRRDVLARMKGMVVPRPSGWRNYLWLPR
jgi:hypothetical protein